MPFALNEGDKFACIVFAHAGIDPDIYNHAPLDLGDGTWVLLRPPIDINEPWREWLGSMTVEHIEGSHFVLLVKQEPTTSERNLREEVDAFFYGFLLQGITLHEAAYRFNGALSDGETSISHFPNFLTIAVLGKV